LIQEVLQRVFPRWTAYTRDNVTKGTQWFTLSLEAVERIMHDFKADESFTLRLLFTEISDEQFISSYLAKVGVPGRGRCDVRYIDWWRTADKELRLFHLEPMMYGHWLFARKWTDQSEMILRPFLDKVRELEADGKLTAGLLGGCNDAWVERPGVITT
jgi:hypothetical protein